ncbi:MAG: ABC transporter ATP-binding protein [Spirochaetaceae bacterium]|jgi:lipoprotein-releasing system ATP-binding protein|nr:ABC transporter ATP-binding protein [Spirochaetaceae bacterium]
MALVEVADLYKSFPSGEETLEILKGVCFTLEAGSSAAVTGRSGSGKSTFLNILGGLDRAGSGSVVVAGSDITRLSEPRLTGYRRGRVGFIFQFHYLLKDFTALENVMIPGFIAGAKKRAARERARSLLADVGLTARLNHYPSQLSGGERQRVAVARAMINEPDLILADEPTGNLDGENSAQVAEMLYAGAEKWGKTLIVVTHDRAVAGRAGTRYTLEAGVLTRAAGEAA